MGARHGAKADKPSAPLRQTVVSDRGSQLAEADWESDLAAAA